MNWALPSFVCNHKSNADARRLLQEIAKDQSQEEIWRTVEPYLIPGDELTAQYAFLDLWKSLYGTA